jgi:hypothetical protein
VCVRERERGSFIIPLDSHIAVYNVRYNRFESVASFVFLVSCVREGKREQSDIASIRVGNSCLRVGFRSYRSIRIKLYRSIDQS